MLDQFLWGHSSRVCDISCLYMLKESRSTLFKPICSNNKLNHLRQETHKQVVLQTVNTQMICGRIRHFIRVCTVCLDKIYLQINTIDQMLLSLYLCLGYIGMDCVIS